MNWNEKLNAREVVTLLVGALVLGIVLYGVDRYVYKPCQIPLSFDTVEGRRVPVFAFLVFAAVVYLTVGRIRWFVKHEGWLLMTAVVTFTIITFIVVRRLCF
jgi:hypothetical protein